MKDRLNRISFDPAVRGMTTDGADVRACIAYCARLAGGHFVDLGPVGGLKIKLDKNGAVWSSSVPP